MDRLFFFTFCIVTWLISVALGAHVQAESPWGELPKHFDPPFKPQNIDPDTATISLSPGFEHGRYDIEISLGETTLYDDKHKPTRSYKGQFVLQSIKLPTDDFNRLSGRLFKNATDELSSVWIEFCQTPKRGEKIQEPYAQRYPVLIQSIRFGQLQRYAIHLEITFRIDFAAGGPPNPWSKRAALNPYPMARAQFGTPNYSKEEWETFCALVKESESKWKEAKYLTNIRLLVNHRYESSTNMNTHKR
jgi:hypothetical protein